ncbi:MAG: DMT family transporter [Pseudomonadota bacterium]
MSEHSTTPKLNFFAGATEDRPALASMLMVGSLFMLSFQDSMVKYASQSISLWQFQCLRSFMNLLLLLVLTRIIWGAGAWPNPKRLWAVVLRSITLVLAMVFFFGGVASLKLADIAAGLYTFPLFVAVLSVLFLGERVGIQRTLAIVLGFVGTVLILKPGSDGFTLVSLMPVGAGVAYACTVLITRKFCREESPVTLAYGVAIVFIMAGMMGVTVFSFEPFPALAKEWPYLFTGWRPLSLFVLSLVALCSLINLISNICLAKAYQTAEVSWLAPFDYSYLVFAAFWGYVMWDQVPDGYSILGMALIAGSGVFVAWREKNLKGIEAVRFKQRWRSLARVLFDPI